MIQARFVQSVGWCDIGKTVNHRSGFGLPSSPVGAAIVAVNLQLITSVEAS